MKHTKIFSILSALFLLGTQVSLAQTVSVDEAQTKASAFFTASKAKSIGGKSTNSLSLAYTSQEGDETYFYVFNNGDNGYVIIGGDEVAHDVLGYSETGSFDYDLIPDNMKWWLSNYSKEISLAIKQVKAGLITSDDIAMSKRRAPRKAKANIDVLLQTKWNQNAPYNSQIPLNKEPGYENALATGCVATAGAQVMKYYEWPTTGVGSASCSSKVNGVNYSADFASTTYEWDKMNNEYSGTYSAESGAAVGTLMFHVGVAADMSYGLISSGGSSASIYDLGKGLIEHFRYAKSMTFEERNYYTDTEWEEMIYNEIAHNRPVVYSGASGSDGSGGHAFVCDGYKDGKFHINWGWGGSHDEYFLLTAVSPDKALTPDGTGIGGGSAASYIYCQNALKGLTPDIDGSSEVVRQIHSPSYTVPSNATIGSSVAIDGFMFNGGFFTENVSFSVKLVNTANSEDVIIVPSTTTFHLEPRNGSRPVRFTVPTTATAGQSYYVYCMYEDENGEYKDIQIASSFTVPSMTVSAPTGIALSKDLKIDNGGYITSTNGHITFSMKNWDSTSVTKRLVVWIYPGGGGTSVGYFDLPNQTFAAGEEKDYDLTYSDITSGTLDSGSDYIIRINDYPDANVYSGAVYLYFRDNLPITYTMTAEQWGTICLPYSADIPAGMKAYKVTGISGNTLVKEEASALEMNKPYLLNGPAGTYNFDGPATPTASNCKNGIMVGSTAASGYVPANSYVLQKQSSGLGFYKVQNADSQSFVQYRAYIKKDGLSAEMYQITDDATVIESVPTDNANAPMYNLNGMRVDGNAKGFVIKNGKLIYVK